MTRLLENVIVVVCDASFFVVGGRTLLERYGKYVLIRKSELDRGEEWFAKHGESAVFISRLLPVVRTYISFPAGIVRMHIKRFSVYTVLGSFPFCFAFAYAGVALGPHWEDISGLLRYFNIAVIVGVVVLVGYLIYRRAWVMERLGERGKQ
jgi:membrane protein DedA with SNARE-associated domain